MIVHHKISDLYKTLGLPFDREIDSKEALNAVYGTDEYKSKMLPLRNKGTLKYI